MPHLELGFSPHEDKPSIDGFRGDLSALPSADLARSATALMDRFFAGVAGSLDRDTLLETGGKLVFSVRKGFLMNMQRLGERAWHMEPEELNFLLEENKPYSEHVPNPKDTEAFARFQIATGLVLQIAADPMISGGFSRNGRLAAPETIAGIYGRIHETGLQMHKVAVSKDDVRRPVSVSLDPWNQPSLTRAYWTLKAMGTIPRKIIGTKEAQEIALEALRKEPKDPLR